MIPLLQIYDNVTSNKYVSLGITIASTVFMASEIMWWMTPLDFTISACAGAIFALMSNIYLVHNKSVKNEGERNSIYASLSLLTFIPAYINPLYLHVYQKISQLLQFSYGYHVDGRAFTTGFGMGFTATNLVMQLMENSNKNQV